MKASTLGLLVLVAVPALAQPDPRARARAEFENAFSGTGLPESREFQEARRRWPEWEQRLAGELPRQDRAVSAGGRELEDALRVYQGNASLRGQAIDFYLAGRLLALGNRLEEAKDAFERSLTNDPYFYWSNHALGTYFMRREMYDAAATQYRRSLDLKPDHLPSGRALALCCLQLKQYERAEGLLRELVRVAPEDLEMRRALGSVLHTRGDHAQAVEQFAWLVQRLPQDLEVARLLALSQLNSGQGSDALQTYERLVQRVPNSWEAWLQYGELLVRFGRNWEGAKAYRQAQQHLPPDTKVDPARVREAIEELERAPEVSTPREPRKSLDDVLNDLLNSADEERRRSASRQLFRAGVFDSKILLGYVRALSDRTRDPVVRTYALKYVDRWLPKESLSDFLPILSVLLREPNLDYRVKAMAVHLAGKSGETVMLKELIPALDTRHPYVFREVHEALNELTYAYIRVDLDGNPDPATMDAIRSEWLAWWQVHRTRYGG